MAKSHGELFTLPQIAEKTKLGVRTIRRYIANGEIAVTRVGGAIRISQASYDEWIARSTQTLRY